MAQIIQRQGTTADRLNADLKVGELFYDLTLNQVYVGNGIATGGVIAQGAPRATPLVLMTGTPTSAPLQFVAGVNLSTPVDGACEYDGAQYWKTVGATRYRDMYSNASALPSAPAVGASPFTYINTTHYDVDVIVVGGTVSALSFSRDGVTFYPLGIVEVPIRLSPSDRLQITYSVAPTLTLIPR